MKILLNTDFLDIYDHWFARQNDPRIDVTFVRRADSREMPKWQQFKILEDVGLKVPTHGAVFCTPWLVEGDLKQEFAVVYTDPYAHRGEGKKLVNGLELEQYQHYFASRYMESRNWKTGDPISYRLLSIGGQHHWFHYEGLGGDWQSNHAPDVEITYLWSREERDRIPKGHYFLLDRKWPLWAIDFVAPANSYQLHAIDFNTAPELKGNGLDLEPKEIYTLIERWFSDHTY